jgi:hypothetical protein
MAIPNAPESGQLTPDRLNWSASFCNQPDLATHPDSIRLSTGTDAGSGGPPPDGSTGQPDQPVALTAQTQGSDQDAERAARVARLDQEYQGWLVEARAGQPDAWANAAESLNAFDKEDMEARLYKLSAEDVGQLHQAALNNPRLGPRSQVALMTTGDPAAPPDPSSEDYKAGYYDGAHGKPRAGGQRKDQALLDYHEGYKSGEKAKKEVDDQLEKTLVIKGGTAVAGKILVKIVKTFGVAGGTIYGIAYSLVTSAECDNRAFVFKCNSCGEQGKPECTEEEAEVDAKNHIKLNPDHAAYPTGPGLNPSGPPPGP